jgi:CubicO group peptidase (beta-lactamase class C family)
MGMFARAVCAASVLLAPVCACSEPAAPGLPSPASDLKTSLSAAFDAMAMPAGSACSISISQHGQVLLERGRGQVAPGKAASVDSLYRIASLTKPITATAILISEKAGRLSRTDKINRYLAYPEPAPTIDELIRHMPGLANYTDTQAYQIGRTSPTTAAALLSLVQPWDGVRRYQYSNSHPILTGTALAQVNGMRYEDVVQRDVFGPAGMSRSSYAIPPASEAFQTPSQTDSSWVLFGGGITSTAADMNRFNQALLGNLFGIGAVESFDRTPTSVTSFGMGSGAPNGDLRFTHTGALDSYSSFSVLFPNDRASIVVLCNYPGSNVLPNVVLGSGGLRSIMLGG